MEKCELSEMTWVEARDALIPGRVVLLPVGTTEQNGPACPLGIDTYIAHYFAVEVAKRTGSLVLPAIPYGCSGAFRSFPGTVWVEAETLRSLARDIARALAHHGVERLVAVNNHGTNLYPVQQALYQVMDETGLRALTVWPSQVIHKMADEDRRNQPVEMGHGGEPMTSVMMAIKSDLVRVDLSPATPQALSPKGDFKIKNSSLASFKGFPVHLYTDIREVSKTGQTGDSSKASSEYGRQLLQRVIQWGVELIYAFKRVE